VSKASYLALISLSTAMILVPYLFSAFYGSKVAFTQKIPTQETPTNTATGHFDKLIAVLASAYCLWLLYAAGLKYLMLSALLYAPGAALYFWAKHQRQQTAFTHTDWAILAALLVLAGVAVTMLVTKQITL
jgi:arginine:ornithine antiporter/lysine permease